ncbi:MAG: hypothetical protein A2845_03465 [Candidatus Lloydbacteria bacterium RIFCSPHIGHO2_01_FULL_49_22]|uniref:dTDP-4-dehydrorhamnose reductase n=1 Tax=Candidatus Lloydbacteria bacterium RIFCSPHIGHO2_01_FULL_49_22 TaxID=1798658 RepID=A0A1G2CX28_9BACT|nr:MAG: hypothetical protein A2845_03465 [Candidatus Lloydbacteria bacterium RIFCSPHIGHO2_01_FULL_49_22]OGZ08990.1 MAG: hypothetical protein A3C14_03300 [Candidatus Lloydbacteria bacterium RIFCSPHIGHO2_02_FULL_50_18]
MNITVYGGGFLGKLIATELNATLDDRHISSQADLEGSSTIPDIIINAAGKTGRPNVDWCEDHKDETYAANVTLVKIFAEHAKKHHIKLVHLSSGCIYEGDNNGKGFSEDDAPNFAGSYYSYTKAEAERILKDYDNVLVVRPRMPITATPTPRNLLNKLLGYQKVIVIPNSITVIEDLLPSLSGLIGAEATGTFNFVNPEPVTHKDILELYEKHSGKKLGKTYISAAELVVKAPRSNTILRADKLRDSGFPMRHTMESLDAIIKRYVELERSAD